jgi:hypothetical protein
MIHTLLGKYFPNPILIYAQISKESVSIRITDGCKSKRSNLLLKVFQLQLPTVAPFAEGIARALWSSTPKRRRLETLSTPLTQTRKREAKNIAAMEKPELVLNAPNVYGICGTSIPTACKYCRICATSIRRENVIKASKLGRLETHKPQAQARRSETQRRQQAARKIWKSESVPDWFNEKFYRDQIQRRISKIQVRTIQIELSVSEPYALRIRGGACIPHPRHWQKLAALANLT